jgi:RNA polymerase sigma-70 factor (ECF subfamily)
VNDQGPDEQLMLYVARDDVAAFDGLFMRHRRGVYNFLFRSLGNHALAEDLTQECFLRVWRSRRTYQPTARFNTWLFTLARHLALDELKRRRVATVALLVEPEDEDRLPLAPALQNRQKSGDPEARLMSRESERALECALMNLPENLREAVLLRDMEGLNYEQIAEVTGVPTGTVKSRLNAARNRLRQAMERRET